MYKRVLFALDLEGVNYVVGVPYSGLSRDSEQWHIARNQAVLEINAAAEALFDAGVEKVALWDNHAGEKNVDPDALDQRIDLLDVDPEKPRMEFAGNDYDCICFFGYHAMEGTLGGVLAHTMSSVSIQYYKLNSKHIGEVDIDAYVAAEHGMPSRFFAGGDIACRQAKRAVNNIVTVETKKEISRNEAIPRDNEELLQEIKTQIVKAIQTEDTPCKLKFPVVMEKSYKRIESAAKYLEYMRSCGIEADYPDDEVLGKDAHTVVSTLRSMDDFLKSI